MQFIKRSWVEIDLNKLEYNFKSIKKAAANRKIFAVVKADAYGHGAEMLVKSFETFGVDGYCVSNINEALTVRKFAAEKPILILGYTPTSNLKLLTKNKISQAIISYEYAKELSEKAVELGVELLCHIKIDTGMGRLGLNCRTDFDKFECLNQIKKISGLKGISLEGIFTHYSSADSLNSDDKNFTEQQFSAFEYIVNNCNIDFKYIHCCNSAGIGLQQNNRGNVVRPGIILYGLLPSYNLKTSLNLRPVLSLKTVIAMVKNIEAGTELSYGRTYKAKEKMKIATVPIGYADGYPRFLSNKGKVLINGKFANIIGRVCMDQMMIDITDIDNVNVGDTVTLIGSDGNNIITADDIAKVGNTINYEILCGISQRITRVYLKDKKPIKYMNYVLSEDENDF